MSTPDRPEGQNTPLGIYDRPRDQGVSGFEVVAIVLTVLWLLGALVFFVVLPEESRPGFDGLRFLVTLLTIFLPVAMIWVAATAAKSQRVIREESARLQAAIDSIRQTQVAQAQRSAAGSEISVAKRLDEIVFQ